MEPDHPLVREVFPDLVAELSALLKQVGEHQLADSVRDIRLVEECECGDDFCKSFRTAEHVPGTPYGPGHRNIPLLPSRGMLILDVVYDRIVFVEVLNRSR